MRIRKVKKEIRILAFDDGPFRKGDGKTVLVGVVFRGGIFMDGLLKREIEVDGTEAEGTIIEAVKGCKFKDLRVIMLDGITFAGFNTVNIRNVHRETGLPVIVVLRKKPDFSSFIRSLKVLPNAQARLKAVEDAGKVSWVSLKVGGKEGKMAFQAAGMSFDDASEILKTSAVHAFVPEPLRAAHLIASGLVLGESVGRA